MSGLESTAPIIMSWAGSGMTRLSVTSFRRLAVVDSLCWAVWLSVIMSGHVPSHYTRPLLAKHLDFGLISPVTGEITECLDQSDDPRGLLAHQLNKRKPKRPKVLHWMDGSPSSKAQNVFGLRQCHVYFSEMLSTHKTQQQSQVCRLRDL